MVDLHKGLDGFDRLEPDNGSGGEKKDVRLSEGNLNDPDVLYKDMIGFVYGSMFRMILLIPIRNMNT